MTKEEREVVQHRLASAGIPRRLYGLKRADFRGKAADLFAYVDSAAYAADTAANRGLCVHGDAAHRTDAFGLIAKGLAAAGQPVQYLTVHALLYFIENDAERRAQLAKTRHLFIDGFEKEFTKDYDCPYTFYQQTEVEEFLESRRNAGLINNYSTRNRWSALRWWSRDFISANAEAVREIAV